MNSKSRPCCNNFCVACASAKRHCQSVCKSVCSSHVPDSMRPEHASSQPGMPTAAELAVLRSCCDSYMLCLYLPCCTAQPSLQARIKCAPSHLPQLCASLLPHPIMRPLMPKVHAILPAARVTNPPKPHALSNLQVMHLHKGQMCHCLRHSL